MPGVSTSRRYPVSRYLKHILHHLNVIVSLLFCGTPSQTMSCCACADVLGSGWHLQRLIQFLTTSEMRRKVNWFLIEISHYSSCYIDSVLKHNRDLVPLFTRLFMLRSIYKVHEEWYSDCAIFSSKLVDFCSPAAVCCHINISVGSWHLPGPCHGGKCN